MPDNTALSIVTFWYWPTFRIEQIADYETFFRHFRKKLSRKEREDEKYGYFFHLSKVCLEDKVNPISVARRNGKNSFSDSVKEAISRVFPFRLKK